MTVSHLEKEENLNLQSLTWGELTWINIENPTEQDIEYLAQHYPFHPLDLDDCLSRIQRPKIDKYNDYLFLVFHFPVFYKEARVTKAGQLSVFIGPDYLITIHKGDLKPLVKLFKECEIDEESRQENFGEGSGYLLYRIVDRLVDYCIPISNKMLENIEDVEDGIFASTRHSQIKEISVIRRDIIAFRRIIWPMRAVIGSLEPNIRRFTQMDLSVYFGDTVDHLDRIWDALDEYKELIEGLNDTHDSLMTNRTNKVIQLLTIISTILLPTTLIASIWGMNINLPFQNSGHPFLYIILIMGSIIGGMLFFFRRKKWI
ncbi:MAG: magnesium/cobalt transporter CorA [Dehalococcoidales bacterium]|nr:magnesium/cobalt transporter CorA [Dehalococcoidales bacterium]